MRRTDILIVYIIYLLFIIEILNDFNEKTSSFCDGYAVVSTLWCVYSIPVCVYRTSAVLLARI